MLKMLISVRIIYPRMSMEMFGKGTDGFNWFSAVAKFQYVKNLLPRYRCVEMKTTLYVHLVLPIYCLFLRSKLVCEKTVVDGNLFILCKGKSVL